jgi:UDP-N-acetylglucosamine--N-acetylmuramyl-(pentapeptide) pyrophosphoryl-undecaprenol N-acetylglucosamine transferase
MKIDPQERIMLIGGHLTPALALAQYFKEHGMNNLVWVGTRFVQTGAVNNSFEYDEVIKLNIPFIELKTGKLWRKWTLTTFFKALYNLLLIPWGSLHSLYVLLRYNPKLIIGFGGYLQVHMIYWGKLLGKYCVIHEQTTVAGSSNLAVKDMVDKIFISWPETMQYFPKSKTILSGNPIRSFLLEPTQEQPLFDNDKPTILVTGGNQGSNTINWRLLKFLPELLREANVIHQVGNSSITNDLQKARDFATALNPDQRSSYIFFSGNFSKEFARYMRSSQLLVCRAGANTVTEILALNKRAVMIPIPWSSQQEQQKNAQLVARTGLGYILKQYDAMPPEELFNAIKLGLERIRQDKDFLGREFSEAQKSASKLFNSNACEIITRELVKI